MSESNAGSRWRGGVTTELTDSALGIWEECCLWTVDTTGLATSLLTLLGGLACHDSSSERVSVWNGVATCCDNAPPLPTRNTLQHTATYCNILQPIATNCNTLQCTVIRCKTLCNTLQHSATTLQQHCNNIATTLQHTARHCNTLQHTTTHCNTLQHTATHCNTLQHTVLNSCNRAPRTCSWVLTCTDKKQ